MDDCGHCSFPVMASFRSNCGGNALNSFQLIQPNKNSTLESVLLQNGPEDWKSKENIKVKASAARSGNFDKFSLNNTVGLVSRILKTDVLWIVFEKISTPATATVSKNAFDVFRSAAASKGLPDPLPNPFNQKQKLFNDVLDHLKSEGVSFNKSDCAGRARHQQAGAATEMIYELTEIIWKVGQAEKQFKSSGLWSKVPQKIVDLATFEQKSKDPIDEFRKAVQDYMVEDRGRHEMQYDGSVVSKVSVGFSMRQMFQEVCVKVKEKYPNCPLPTSEAMISRYLIPRTKAAAETACTSQPLIPLKLAMQQKVIEKPNVDAHYNAAQFKYLKHFAVDLGPELVTMVGWDDKTGVDVGEPEQPTAATQHMRKSWVHSDVTVGEGQHSFHKTNLTPSVRLVHDIGDSVDDSFYRGTPQVVIKDTIFQHSTSARHATELYQMMQLASQLKKPVLILSNDGGVDHTIRHERNVVALLALFLRLPDTLLLVNFQFAAYRSAYHPVEKLNCILNLAWNGVCLSREPLEDPVLEDVFKQCSSMSEVRMKAERHSGIKTSLHKSLEPSMEILEKRAQQASLKGNYFETFKPATNEEIKDFLNIILEIDPAFDVEKFMDKTKPYHYTPQLKTYIEKHVTGTYYALTYKKHPDMTKDFLTANYPDFDWQINLEQLPCPTVDLENPEKYLSYNKVKDLPVKDYTDKCRPGKNLKVPANIPFTKSKFRAIYGENVVIECDACNKRRVVYFEHKPSKEEIKSAKSALHSIRYVCGGRMASFGRSLAVMEEIANASNDTAEVFDEVCNEVMETTNEYVVPRKKKMILESDDSDLDDNLFHEAKLSEGPTKCNMEIDDEFESSAATKNTYLDLDGSDDDVLEVLINPEQSMTTEEDDSDKIVYANRHNDIMCSFCDNFKTGHKCKTCNLACCNLCNTVLVVEHIMDIICPNCESLSVNTQNSPKLDSEVFPNVGIENSRKKSRGRPRKITPTGQILIPLQKRKRGRPCKVIDETDLGIDEDVNNNEEDLYPPEEVKVNEESLFSEMRILGNGSILKKIFVDESLTCETPIEPHMFDVLLNLQKPLPCYYCGEKDENLIIAKLTDESFPLCERCSEKGRGAGLRRKGRKITPKPIKDPKPKAAKFTKKKKGKLI